MNFRKQNPKAVVYDAQRLFLRPLPHRKKIFAGCSKNKLDKLAKLQYN